MKIKALLEHFIVWNQHIKGLLRIMKISIFFLFICVVHLFATNAEAQNAYIEIDKDALSIKELFTEIEVQTDYLVVYRNREVDINRTVNLKNHSGEVVALLKDVFDETDIGFEFENNYIVFSKKPAKENLPISQQDNRINITGNITDESGESIIGANILIKGTTIGVITDFEGNFSLMVPPGAVLQVSYIGYLAREIAVNNQTVIKIQLREDTQALEEVVVVGYGVQKKENLTGAVSMANMEKVLGDRPVTSVGAALQGAIPGLVITGNARPGESKSFNIRGTTSINGGEPLILVDNVPAEIDLINPEDIESVSVLKDAASAAIYGARGAFGVILITTKKAKKKIELQ